MPWYDAPYTTDWQYQISRISSRVNCVADQSWRNLVKMRNDRLIVFVSFIKCQDVMIHDKIHGILRIILLYGILFLQVVCLGDMKLK